MFSYDIKVVVYLIDCFSWKDHNSIINRAYYPRKEYCSRLLRLDLSIVPPGLIYVS